MLDHGHHFGVVVASIPLAPYATRDFLIGSLSVTGPRHRHREREKGCSDEEGNIFFFLVRLTNHTSRFFGLKYLEDGQYKVGTKDAQSNMCPSILLGNPGRQGF